MTRRERVHQIVDTLPDRELGTAARVLEGLATLADPVLRALALPRDDDEPETEEERDAVSEARAALAAGKGIPSEQLKRELGL